MKWRRRKRRKRRKRRRRKRRNANKGIKTRLKNKTRIMPRKLRMNDGGKRGRWKECGGGGKEERRKKYGNVKLREGRKVKQGEKIERLTVFI